jgi:hypothetical protein
MKFDANGNHYWEGDNIRITGRDLEWITRPANMPPEATQAKRRERVIYHTIQLRSRDVEDRR